MATFGDLPTCLETIALLDGDVWLMLDTDDMYQLVVSHFGPFTLCLLRQFMSSSGVSTYITGTYG